MTEHETKCVESFCRDLQAVFEKHGTTIVLDSVSKKATVTIVVDESEKQYSFDIEDFCWEHKIFDIIMRVYWLEGEGEN